MSSRINDGDSPPLLAADAAVLVLVSAIMVAQCTGVGVVGRETKNEHNDWRDTYRTRTILKLILESWPLLVLAYRCAPHTRSIAQEVDHVGWH